VRKVQRVAAYAVIIRDDHILLSRLAEHLTAKELWTLPGGGLEHGEDPRDAVVREVHEETGLDVEIGETAHVYSSHQRNTWRHGRRADAHSLRIVYDGWVPVDAPEPRVVEVDGSTVEAAWKPLVDVLEGRVPTVALVTEVLERHRTFRLQRVAAYVLVVRGDEVLLVRNSPRGPSPGGWTLPGGGIEHGESPQQAAVRETYEETGLACEVGEVLLVADSHFEGTAPSGRTEDFHTVQIVFEGRVPDDSDPPRVVEQGGTSDAAAWVPLAGLDSLNLRPNVRAALAARAQREVS
jgi:ADP-ribose pyrophosphatase YjhB (NUDIX family)